MTHQAEIEKRKYRNWVRGGLAYKYLKQGLEDFADDVVKQEHRQILSAINHTVATSCNLCCLRNLQPIHTCKRDYDGKKMCPYGQFSCNCLQGKKQRCPSNICDGIMEEILKSHGSSPPQPYWQNTDIQKWCLEPWEVAKCFINAPGYSDKTKAADIDISGLLHVFINNTSLHSHLACSMAGTNVFTKVRERRNKLFHSATMEIEEGEMIECIDKIVEILEDPKQLRGRPEAQRAVDKLKQLKHSDFLITTHNEVEVCREALASVNMKSIEMEQTIQDAKKFISDEEKKIVERLQHAVDKHKDDVKDISHQVTGTAKETIQNSLHGAVKEFDKHSEILYERVKKLDTGVSERVGKMETDVSVRIKKLETDVSVTVKKLETDVSERVGKLEKRVTSLEELDCIRQMFKKHLDYVKAKQELQDKLVKFYQEYYVKTSLSPLKQQQDSVNIKDVYVHPEIEVIEEEEDVDSIQEVIGKRMTQLPWKKNEMGYHEIFQTESQRNKKIYILGNYGTGKSTFCKMMIENWCNAVSGSNEGLICDKKAHGRIECIDTSMATRYDDDVSQMGQYDFLFFIPLQCMSAFMSDDIVDMIKELTRNLTSDTELIDRIFQEDSRRCLIIVDSLDEWTPPKKVIRKLHVSYGIPNGDQALDAIVITLSRPSAKGILNLKNSEFDLKLKILGISSEMLMPFIERYISKSTVTDKSCKEFMSLCKSNQIEHVEKTPLLLQQLLWLYCNGKELGNSVCETYCHIFNTVYGWSDHKNNVCDNDASQSRQDYKTIHLPAMLQKFPRLKKNKRFLFRLGRIAYETLTSDLQAKCRFSCLIKKDLSDCDIDQLTRFGILNESACYDPTLEDTQLAFIHISYLEFFAAVYVTTCHNMEQTTSLKQSHREVLVLDELFGICKSASDVLQLSNVIKMVCGLSPVLTSDLSKRISCIVNKDKHILQLRQSRSGSWHDETNQIQSLIIDCLEECGFDDKTMISLSDLNIGNFKLTPQLLRRINPGDVISLTIKSNEIMIEVVKHCINLQFMHIANAHNLIINLSKHKQLQVLELIGCENVNISVLNPEQLERLHIIRCTGIPVLDFDCLLNASRLTNVCLEHYTCDLVSLSSLSHQLQLRQLTLKTVRCNKGEQHDFDLSGQNHLQKLSLEECPDIVITGINTAQLEQAFIHNCYNALSIKLVNSRNSRTLHINGLTGKKAILRPLLEYTSLRELSLDNVKCFQSERLDIDLSGLNHLQKLRLVECHDIVITEINTAQLEHAYIQNCCEVIDVKLLSNSNKTMTLTLDNLKSYKEQRLDLSGHNHLQNLVLVECPNIIITRINTTQLRQVYIDEIKGFLSAETKLPVKNIDLQLISSKLTELLLKKVTVNIASLVLIIQQAPLRQLTLIHVFGDQALDGPMHVMDLTKQNQLRELMVKHCGQIQISNINTGRLVHVNINDSSLDFYSSIPTVSNTSKLIEIHLEKLTCNKASLIALLQQTSLRDLILIHVCVHQCDDDCFMHETNVDLSKHNQLQILNLPYCKNIKISELNTENLENVHISAGILDFDLLSNASRLTELTLQDNYVGRFQYSRQVGYIVQTLHQLRKLTLLNVDIYDNALTVTPEMSLTHIKLDNAIMSIDTWRTFVDSLLTLRQFGKVTVHINEGVKEFYDYVLTHPKFVVICESKLGLVVRSDRPRRIYHFL